MSDSTVAVLERRLEILERQVRGWRRLGGLVMVLALGLVAMGQASKEVVPEVVKARRFELVDRADAVVAVLGAEHGLYPYLRLEKGGAQGAGGSVILEVPSGIGPSLTLLDAEGRKRAQLLLGGHLGQIEGEKGRYIDAQVPKLFFIDEAGQLRAHFGGTSVGDGVELRIRDSEGKVLFRAPQ